MLFCWQASAASCRALPGLSPASCASVAFLEANLPPFAGLSASLTADCDEWQTWAASDDPSTTSLPGTQRLHMHIVIYGFYGR
jgi:hypothetical protein